jgi:hypothetical protein
MGLVRVRENCHPEAAESLAKRATPNEGPMYLNFHDESPPVIRSEARGRGRPRHTFHFSFHDSPPSVSLIPARTVNGSEGYPKASL